MEKLFNQVNNSALKELENTLNVFFEKRKKSNSLTGSIPIKFKKNIISFKLLDNVEKYVEKYSAICGADHHYGMRGIYSHHSIKLLTKSFKYSITQDGIRGEEELTTKFPAVNCKNIDTLIKLIPVMHDNDYLISDDTKSREIIKLLNKDYYSFLNTKLKIK